MLSLGGGASALTFKSDGSVVQSDGRVVKETKKTREYRQRYGPTEKVQSLADDVLCNRATFQGKWSTSLRNKFIVKEAKLRGLACGVSETTVAFSNEPWHAANSKSYEKLALKYWCIANLTGENVRAEPFLDAKAKEINRVQMMVLGVVDLEMLQRRPSHKTHTIQGC